MTDYEALEYLRNEYEQACEIAVMLGNKDLKHISAIKVAIQVLENELKGNTIFYGIDGNEYYREKTKRMIDADELMKRIRDKGSQLKNVDTINGLAGALAIVYDMLHESGQEIK